MHVLRSGMRRTGQIPARGSTKLNGDTSAETKFALTYTCTNTYQGREGSLVESRSAFILEDLGSAIQGVGILCGCLEANLDDI